MRFFTIPTLLSLAVIGNAFTYERLDKNDSVLLLVDHQVGLFSLARDFDPTLFRDNMYAHAELGRTFDLPVIMTTSAETGPNGPLPGEFPEWFPDAPIIKRDGEINAWDNAEFRDALKATGKSQVIIGGIVTDVCTAFLALSLREAGYSVWANVDASGTTSLLSRESANDRMRDAGVHVVSFYAIFGELMRDWRNVPGEAEVWPMLDKYFPVAGMVARAHRAAVENGTVGVGEGKLP